MNPDKPNMSDTFEHASMLSLIFKEKAALHAAYMPYLRGGGLFIPTDKAHGMGEPLSMLLSLIDEPIKLQVLGHVAWLSPTNQGEKPQGVGVRFSDDEGGRTAREKIEQLLGAALNSSRHTHTM